MKKYILISAILILSGCDGEKNYDNLLQIKKGMTITEVNSIMENNHKAITISHSDSWLAQYYDAPFGASDDLGIIFNDSVVIDIQYGD